MFSASGQYIRTPFPWKIYFYFAISLHFTLCTSVKQQKTQVKGLAIALASPFLMDALCICIFQAMVQIVRRHVVAL